MRTFIAALFTVAMLFPAVAQAAASIYEPVTAEAGTWDADITFYDQAGKPQAKHGVGVQVNTLLKNRHWITNAFTVNGTPYEGHGVWGYDPVAKAYIDTWVDTWDSAVRTDYGYWDATDHTMYWSAKQPDGKGHFVDYRMVEAFRGNTRIFTMYQVGMEKTTLYPLVRINFTKRV